MSKHTCETCEYAGLRSSEHPCGGCFHSSRWEAKNPTTLEVLRRLGDEMQQAVEAVNPPLSGRLLQTDYEEGMLDGLSKAFKLITTEIERLEGTEEKS